MTSKIVSRPVASNDWLCRKRNGTTVPFDSEKIRVAVSGCFRDVNLTPSVAEPLALAATTAVIAKIAASKIEGESGPKIPGVEHIQRLVIQWLWTNGLFDAAEAYQNYREHHRKKRDLETACIFDRRIAFKPFDYPEVEKFKKAIHDSFWLVSDWDGFTSDVQDYHVTMTDVERSAAARAMLAISQVEVAVKEFWVKLGDRFPRPEFKQVGITFGDSEVRHSDAYSELLNILGLNDAFKDILETPAIKSRVDYLNRALRTSSGGSDKAFTKTLTVFSLFVENVSLFGQFAIIKSFAKHRHLLNTIDNVVSATQLEEQVHALFGSYVLNLIKEERPEWFDIDFYTELAELCREALTAETAIVDWIFEAGELPFIPKASVIEFIKDRFNDGFRMIGGPEIFDIDHDLLKPLRWFVEGLYATVDVDFFFKKSTNYGRGSKPLTTDATDELF